MTHKYFKKISQPIQYEGPKSRNPMAFRYYNPTRIVAGQPMDDHLKFAIAYWHTFKGSGADPFGGPVYARPWEKGKNPLKRAENTMDAAFEFFTKLGVNYYCFHDRDIAPESDDWSQTIRDLESMVQRAKKLQADTGVRLLWGTANLFSHPRYTHGSATNPDPHVFACAATQVRHAIDATIELDGGGYVFWGGREGYSSLYNTDMKQERAQLAALLHMAVDYGRAAGFNGAFFIEPKPKEPSVHQYDYDAATVLGFLQEFDLMSDFMLNIEVNHATLAGHTFEHDITIAAQANKLGSLDINRGHPLLGWDTDQFPTDPLTAAWTMVVLLRQGGLPFGGLNFDAKVRRGSTDTLDLFHAHIGGMDTFARGLLVADRIIRDGELDKIVAERYAGFQKGIGKKILEGGVSLPELEKWMLKKSEPALISGREEALENMLNDYLYCTEL